jgi:hypothetical protein
VGEKDMDIVLVRKSGPVQSMKFKPWWIYFLFLVLMLMLAGLGAGSYLLYHQQQALKAIAEDTRLLMLRAERLEALVQEQETRALLAQQAEQERAHAQAVAAAKKGRAAEEKKPAAEAGAKPAAAESKPKPEAKPETRQAAAHDLPPEPTSSDLVGVKLVRVRRQGSELKVIFDVTNRREPATPAVGYVTVVLRAQRAGRPWIEAWPPMRLTPLGRPINYRRGTPFSVQRYRRLKANFAIGDKVFERLEFLVYSREGELLLVSRRDLTPQGEPKPAGDNG